VRPIDRKFITDIHDVRGALYPLIYRDAIAGADRALDKALLQIQRRFDLMMERGDTNGCRDSNQLLHATIEARCHNEEVSALIRRYSNLTRSLRDVFGFDAERIRQISLEHWAILEAFFARDVGKAVAAAQHHSAQALVNMRKHFKDPAEVPAHG
jgi:DNA-binding GntR family transcriptional regulator